MLAFISSLLYVVAFSTAVALWAANLFRWLKEESKNFDKIKKVVEVGNWYQHFQSTPLQETLRAFGSPIYAPGAGSYWSSRGYFSGYGMNPEIHHSLYGAGFANLPTELGGQIAGRSRLSGSPME